MPKLIKSKDNPEIKFLRSLNTKKKRKEHRFFLVEGFRSTAEALNAGKAPKIYVSEEALPAVHKMPAITDLTVITEEVMKSVSETKTPPGIIAACPFLDQDYRSIISSKKKFAFLDAINDPGNAGTLIRSACAAGLDGVLLSRNCADLYNPKTVRATMGSIFNIHISVNVDIDEFMRIVHAARLRSVGLSAEAEKNIYDVDFEGSIVLFIGSESAGLSETLISQVQEIAKIPMSSRVDSLNAAVAGSIAMMEFQRRSL